MQTPLFSKIGFSDVEQGPTNVASVPKRSPFRYPGGKTWLIPVIREWMKQSSDRPKILIEPFAGGGSVGLTAGFENLADKVLMIEKDEEIAAVWEVIINGDFRSLAERIFSFQLSSESAVQELERTSKSLDDMAFCTILKNRIFHGGILAKGSGLIKNGENGKGIASRWYPKTLRDRILAIGFERKKFQFQTGDAFEVLDKSHDREDAYFFIDPPYVVAGRRLYTHFEVDHERLFDSVARLKGKFMLTYDNAEEVRSLAKRFGFDFRTIPMKTTHHLKKEELIICDDFSWWNN